MEGKKVSESAVLMAQLMSPQDANIAGNVHGGVIMKLIDDAGGAVAYRHARSNVVTVSIDRLSFDHPVLVGDLVTFKASINMAGRTSMDVGVRVEAENLLTGEVRHAASAYLTYVALGADSKPTPVAPLILENEEQERRFRKALARRNIRKQERENP
ncbi:MAG TPA: acyl-CoA thioesterase [Syntrophorhabdales bacterium]|nr:acyl-CoA thioesterase [Syntrophorhabdales bacterium]